MRQKVEALHWKPGEGAKVQCQLCPHSCVIGDGGKGICGTRVNRKGVLYADGHGIYPVVHLDPIEKKPLNHFLPGRRILSVGSVGCNLKCRHCQNFSLSCDGPEGMEDYYLPPETLVEGALEKGSIGVAFTYNEPTINFEYLMEVSPKLRSKGAKVVHVTNGHLSEGPWTELMEHTDAANIDVKGFTEDFYRRIVGGHLAPVLRNVEIAVRNDVHVEIAYLVIPGLNDDDDQLKGFVGWVLSSLGPDVPIHFTRFHPDNKMLDIPPTPVDTLFRARKSAMETGVHYVYVGNIWDDETGNTRCPQCSALLVSREGFSAKVMNMKDGRCGKCGLEIAGVW